MRYIQLAVILFLFVSPVWATDYYVRPPSGEYNDEDGSDYDNAYDGFADISWATVDSGNGKLFVCGTFNDELVQINTSGEDGTPIHVTSCTVANGASVDDPGILDGDDTRAYGIIINNVTPDGSYITIDGLTITEMD
jgi:hypothetical protein